MLPPELVELIILYGWLTLSTSSHRHAYSMTQWMLVSREWLSTAVPIFLRDVWATNRCVMFHIEDAASSDYPGITYKLAGIPDVKEYLARNCRSLTVSIHQVRTGEYDRQCTELAEYVADPNRQHVAEHRWGSKREPYCGIPFNRLRNSILDWLPSITSLHFVLVDCLPTYWYWHMEYDMLLMVENVGRAWSMDAFKRDRITDVHFTFAYTSPPPPALVRAPRGTFYPPRDPFADLPSDFPEFDAVKRIVVREANADFVAFLATKFPKLECIESTAAFGADDLPPEVAAAVAERLVFRRLAPTTEWGITGSDLNVSPERAGVARVFTQLAARTTELGGSDSDVRPKDDPPSPTTADPQFIQNKQSDSPPALEKKKPSLWSIVRRAFRKRKYPV